MAKPSGPTIESCFAAQRNPPESDAAPIGKALSHPYFAAPEPQELIYEEIEAIRGRIDQADDWSAFEAKLAALETASQAYEPSED